MNIMAEANSEREQFLTTAEAEEQLGISNATFLKYVRELGIGSYKGVGRTKRYRKEDIERIYRERIQLRPTDE